MNTAEWLNLASTSDWVWGSDDCPIYLPVKDMCMLGLRTSRIMRGVAKRLGDFKRNETSGHIPDLFDMEEKKNRMLGLFENHCITCYSPTEKDITKKAVITGSGEPKETEDGETEEMNAEQIDEVFKEVGEMKESVLKPEDVEARKVANEIASTNKNPLEMFKETIRIVKDNTDVSKMYKRGGQITVNQIVDTMFEIDKAMVFIHSTLDFAKRHGGNKDGIRASVLFFMGMVPERHAKTKEEKETFVVKNT